MQLIGSIQFLTGISNIVGEIISKIGETELHNIATQSGKSVFDKNNPLHLETIENSFDKPIYKGIRAIPKPKEGEELYYSKPYRYFNYPGIQPVYP